MIHTNALATPTPVRIRTYGNIVAMLPSGSRVAVTLVPRMDNGIGALRKYSGTWVKPALCGRVGTASGLLPGRRREKPRVHRFPAHLSARPVVLFPSEMMKYPLLVLCLVLTGCTGSDRPQVKQTCLFSRDGRPIPNDGLPKFPNAADASKWSPEEVERDFQRIYRGIVLFHQRFGKLPRLSELKEKGIVVDRRPIDDADLTTPDARFREDLAILLHGSIDPRVYAGPKQWKLLPGEKPFPHGLRRPLVTTWIYARTNPTLFRDCSETYRIDGFVVVLWTDGTIERVPHSRILTYDRPGSNRHPLLIPADPSNPADTILFRDWFSRCVGEHRERFSYDDDAVIGN